MHSRWAQWCPSLWRKKAWRRQKVHTLSLSRRGTWTTPWGEGWFFTEGNLTVPARSPVWRQAKRKYSFIKHGNAVCVFYEALPCEHTNDKLVLFTIHRSSVSDLHSQISGRNHTTHARTSFAAILPPSWNGRNTFQSRTKLGLHINSRYILYSSVDAPSVCLWLRYNMYVQQCRISSHNLSSKPHLRSLYFY